MTERVKIIMVDTNVWVDLGAAARRHAVASYAMPSER